MVDTNISAIKLELSNKSIFTSPPKTMLLPKRTSSANVSSKIFKNSVLFLPAGLYITPNKNDFLLTRILTQSCSILSEMKLSFKTSYKKDDFK